MNILLLLQFLFAQLSIDSTLDISVIYPRLSNNDTFIYIAQVDSNFIFGSVNNPDAMLTINDYHIPLYSNGTFIAWLPVDWDSKQYELVATLDSTTVNKTIQFDSPSLGGELTPPSHEYPIHTTLKKGVIRTHPKGAYYIFQEADTPVRLEEWQDGYYRINLQDGRNGWVASWYIDSVSDDTTDWNPIAWKAGLSHTSNRDVLSIPIGEKLLYRVDQSENGHKLSVTLFGLISHIDRINYADNLQVVDQVNWDQPFDKIMRIDISLNEPCWGYNTEFVDGVFNLEVAKAPQSSMISLKGVHIALDAGHGGDQWGAVGASGCMEKDANLALTIAAKKTFEEAGAFVSLTRVEDEAVGLNERIKIAEEAGADILISLHHNALPDGTSPFQNFGTEVYYYQPQSLQLAKLVHQQITEGLGLLGGGVAYNNLALVRPTSMPAILIEAAYLMLPEHELLMKHPDYNKVVSQAILKGVKQYLTAYDHR